jgi:hypothetical protein
LKLRMFVLSLTTVVASLTILTAAPRPSSAQQPSPQQAPSQPSQPALPTPQPAPQQTVPSTQPTPTTPQPAPQQTTAQPGSQLAATTLEGAVTNVSGVTCRVTQGAMNNTMISNTTVSTTTTTNTVGTMTTSSVSNSGTTPAITGQTTGQTCSGVLELAPGVNWAQVVRSEERGEGPDGLPAIGIPVRVFIGPNTTVTSRSSAVSLMDLKQGSTVRVDYNVMNDVNVATAVDVTSIR